MTAMVIINDDDDHHQPRGVVVVSTGKNTFHSTDFICRLAFVATSSEQSAPCDAAKWSGQFHGVRGVPALKTNHLQIRVLFGCCSPEFVSVPVLWPCFEFVSVAGVVVVVAAGTWAIRSVVELLEQCGATVYSYSDTWLTEVVNLHTRIVSKQRLFVCLCVFEFVQLVNAFLKCTLSQLAATTFFVLDGVVVVVQHKKKLQLKFAVWPLCASTFIHR